MNNIEIKQIIDNKVAVLRGGYSRWIESLDVRIFFNLDRIVSFEIHKLKEEENEFINRPITEDNKINKLIDDIFFEDKHIKEFVKPKSTYSLDYLDSEKDPIRHQISIPKGTPIITLYFSSNDYLSLFFLHHGEYQKFKRIITGEND